MSDEPPGSWTNETSGRERVRYVVELLDGSTPVDEIAERAAVSWTTADDELQRLASDDWVTETVVDGKKAYDLNPVRMLFDEITDLIEHNTRDELEQRLAKLTAEREELADEYGAASLSAFREQLLDEDLSAEDVRERRNVIETWEALDADLGLVRNALHLYDDVTELSSPRTNSASTYV